LHDLAERISGGAIVPPPAIDPRTLKAAFEKFRLDQREQFVAPAFPATPKLLQIRLQSTSPCCNPHIKNPKLSLPTLSCTPWRLRYVAIVGMSALNKHVRCKGDLFLKV
jgi:hypothetical protein